MILFMAGAAFGIGLTLMMFYLWRRLGPTRFTLALAGMVLVIGLIWWLTRL